MGIKDLLKFVKPYVEPIHIKKYAGHRVNPSSVSVSYLIFPLIEYPQPVLHSELFIFLVNFLI